VTLSFKDIAEELYKIKKKRKANKTTESPTERLQTDTLSWK